MKLNKRKIIIEMERLGWNQTELSRRMNTHKQQINRILKEKNPSVGLIMINKFGEALGIDPKELLI